MDIKGSYASDVRNSEPFGGVITFLDIVPVANSFSQPIKFSLFINNIDTGKSIIINPHQSNIQYNMISQQFSKNDLIYWICQSNDTTGNMFIGNVRVLINYIG